MLSNVSFIYFIISVSYKLFLNLQNLEYVIVSGARRQENRWDPTENEQIVPEDKETSKRLFDDAMFKLEHGTSEKNRVNKVSPALAKLQCRNDAKWRDDFAANSNLRAIFRASIDNFLFYFYFLKQPDLL